MYDDGPYWELPEDFEITHIHATNGAPPPPMDHKIQMLQVKTIEVAAL